MPDITENWTAEQFRHYQKTGQTPDQAFKIEKKFKAQEKRAEKDLQQTCENWLHHRGYLRLTADNAIERTNEFDQIKGWFGHLVEAKKNPLMPDIMLFDYFMERCLMVELKVRNVWQPGQKDMVNRGAWFVAFDYQTFESMVKAWESNHGA